MRRPSARSEGCSQFLSEGGKEELKEDWLELGEKKIM